MDITHQKAMLLENGTYLPHHALLRIHHYMGCDRWRLEKAIHWSDPPRFEVRCSDGEGYDDQACSQKQQTMGIILLFSWRWHNIATTNPRIVRCYSHMAKFAYTLSMFIVIGAQQIAIQYLFRSTWFQLAIHIYLRYSMMVLIQSLSQRYVYQRWYGRWLKRHIFRFHVVTHIPTTFPHCSAPPLRFLQFCNGCDRI